MNEINWDELPNAIKPGSSWIVKDSIIDNSEQVNVDPRRGSSYFCQRLLYISTEDAELLGNPDYTGYWITETYIDDWEYGTDHEPDTFYRAKGEEVTTITWSKA
jgi:hypothetical protein